jgi:hypothetical protein
MVTTWPAVDPVAVQLENPVGSVMVGVAGITKPAANVTVMVLPPDRWPLDDAVKPSVQVAVAPPVCGDPANDTLVGDEPMIVTGELGDALAASFVVERTNVFAAYEPWGGFVMPAIPTVPDVLFAKAHVPRLFAKVMVTMPEEAVAVAEQWLKPVGSVIVGVPDTVNEGLNFTKIWLPAARAPVEEVVNPSVQVVLAVFCTIDEPEKVTFVTEVGDITTARAGMAAAVSFEVATLNVLAA